MPIVQSARRLLLNRRGWCSAIVAVVVVAGCSRASPLGKLASSDPSGRLTRWEPTPTPTAITSGTLRDVALALADRPNAVAVTSFEAGAVCRS